MTVRMLVQWTAPNGAVYLPNNLYTGDAGTEAGLVAAKLADSNLTGGTTYTAPTPPEQSDDTLGLRVFTWAGRPDPRSIAQGEIIRISDVGGWNGSTYSGSHWYSDGTQLRPVSGRLLLGQSSVAINSGAGGSGDQSLLQMTIPGGLMGLNGQLVITSAFSASGTAESKTQRILFGGVQFAAYSGASGGTLRGSQFIHNRNSEAVQIAGPTPNFASFGTAMSWTNLTINTANDAVLDWRTTPGATETTILQSWVVELLK